MNPYINYLNSLWTKYLRKIAESEKLKLLIHTSEEVVDFLMNSELYHSESYGGALNNASYNIIYLKRNDDVLTFRKEFYENIPSKVVFHIEVPDNESGANEFLVEWFTNINLHYYHGQFEALQKYAYYFMTFLKYIKCEIADIQYATMDKENSFNVCVQSEKYRIIHKNHIDSLAKKRMIELMYGEVFSYNTVLLSDLSKLSGIPVVKISEMYHLEKKETLDDRKASEFIEKYVDKDAYYRKEFDKYGYLGLLGNKKYPEVISGDFYIFRAK